MLCLWHIKFCPVSDESKAVFSLKNLLFCIVLEGLPFEASGPYIPEIGIACQLGLWTKYTFSLKRKHVYKNEQTQMVAYVDTQLTLCISLYYHINVFAVSIMPQSQGKRNGSNLFEAWPAVKISLDVPREGDITRGVSLLVLLNVDVLADQSRYFVSLLSKHG